MVDLQKVLEEKNRLEEEAKLLASTINAASSSDEEKLNAENEYLKIKLRINDIKRNSGSIAQTAVRAGDMIEKVKSTPSVPRYETGVRVLDQALNGGIEIGTLVQLAGQSFAGKTHLTLEILSNVSVSNEVLFFNFEMGERRISSRLDKLLATPSQRNNMLIDGITRDLDAICRSIEYYSKKGVKFFAIDSKMKIDVPSEKDEHKKYSAISSALSKLTQQFEVIIFLINQMSEEDIKTNRLAFKGSGDQMYDTDIAFFFMLDKKNTKNRELVCRKNRQDETNFKLQLTLDNNNRTVGIHEAQTVVEYQHEGFNSGLWFAS